MGLYEELRQWNSLDFYPYHMPGHKRKMQAHPLHAAYDIDITEIEGFDNLYYPTGILKDAQERVAKLYGADESFYLINGSSGGMISAISACTAFNDKVLVARNCHKSVYNAICLRGLKAVYIMPEPFFPYDLFGPISADVVAHALAKNSGVKAVILTSPTYEGICSDIEAISKSVHEYGIPLIVDSAHGAHMGLSTCTSLPPNPINAGADLVIQSAHKTLPAMTQTAVLHYKGGLVDVNRVKEALSIYQSSSPSYILMASLDTCYECIERDGEALFTAFYNRLHSFYERVANLQTIQVLTETNFKEICSQIPFWHDKGKVIISGARIGMTGREICDILYRRYHLQMEMVVGSYALAMMTVMDQDEGFDRLANALCEVDSELKECRAAAERLNQENTTMLTQMSAIFQTPEVVLSSAEVDGLQKGVKQCGIQTIPLHLAAGKVSAEYMYLYPPGIPIVVPGEKIGEMIPDCIATLQSSGYEIHGMRDSNGSFIDIVTNTQEGIGLNG